MRSRSLRHWEDQRVALGYSQVNVNGEQLLGQVPWFSEVEQVASPHTGAESSPDDESAVHADDTPAARTNAHDRIEAPLQSSRWADCGTLTIHAILVVCINQGPLPSLGRDLRRVSA